MNVPRLMTSYFAFFVEYYYRWLQRGRTDGTQ